MILRGSIDVQLSATSSLTRYRGETFGEVSFFCGGKRSATCRAAQDGTLIATLAFDRIWDAAILQPALACKLVDVFARVPAHAREHAHLAHACSRLRRGTRARSHARTCSPRQRSKSSWRSTIWSHRQVYV